MNSAFRLGIVNISMLKAQRVRWMLLNKTLLNWPLLLKGNFTDSSVWNTREAGDINVTSFFSISYWNNIEYWSQKHSSSGSILCSIAQRFSSLCYRENAIGSLVSLVSGVLKFYTFLPAQCVSIPSPKYQSKLTNPHFFQTAFVTSSR